MGCRHPRLSVSPKYGVNMHLDGTSRGLLFLIGDGSVAGGLFLSGGLRRVRGYGFIDVCHRCGIGG